MGDRYASLAMYPFDALRQSWERVWRGVGTLCEELRVPLRWDGDLAEQWTDPDCVLSHSCGWPVTTRLGSFVQVVGAFDYDVSGAEAHRYRSAVIARRSTQPLDDADHRPSAAANSDDSLSGWVSLRHVLHVHDLDAPGSIEWTGSHLASVHAVVDGRAELASIDAVSWAHIERLFPELVELVHVIAHGPLVPSTPIVMPRSTPDGTVDAARAAIAGALIGAGELTRDELRITSFVPLDDDDYDELRQLSN